ncbi:RE1-silencing transcription factor-like [Zophobas morio]|uniref:RE1-silencing transcription factor-like n=1 Tax=Zophobas morio TaxID=2755281 RepID=UPI003083185E
MSNRSSFTVDDDFTMEVHEEADTDSTVAAIKQEPEDTKPIIVKDELDLHCNDEAIPLETKKELHHFFARNKKTDPKGKQTPVEKAALEFKTQSILREYKDMVAEGLLKRPFECPICQYKTDRFSVIQNHVNNHLTQQKEYRCNVCNYVAFSKGNLTMHRARCVYKYKRSCPHCSFVTVRNKNFRRHMLRHTAKFACISCKFYSDDDKEIEEHKKACRKGDGSGMDDKCDLCEFRNDDEVVLAEHTEEKHPEYELKCDDCDFVTSRKRWLFKHRQQSHRTVNRTWKCSLCDFTTGVKGGMGIHMKTHVKK